MNVLLDEHLPYKITIAILKWQMVFTTKLAIS